MRGGGQECVLHLQRLEVRGQRLEVRLQSGELKSYLALLASPESHRFPSPAGTAKK
jgi:hypothetical protein